ncbi:MAG TPA: hypothetical protein PLC04_03515 [Candidatus Kapabacteria bacterium]|jgi:hypothetical protein|nr:hypothetical protein [Candidatus Kapabacteria bacterium]HOV92132.1 hypothetical protein [Candidatus Kapabacteria bacterium]
MEIKPVNTQKNALSNESSKISKKLDKKENNSEVNESSVDKLETSPDLLELKPVIDKLHSGFYDQPEVLAKLASILDEKFPPEKLKEA